MWKDAALVRGRSTLTFSILRISLCDLRPANSPTCDGIMPLFSSGMPPSSVTTSDRRLVNFTSRQSPSLTRSTIGRGRLSGLSLAFPGRSGLDGSSATTSARSANSMPAGTNAENLFST